MVTYLNDHWSSKEKIQYNKTETYKTLLAVPNSVYNTQLQLFTNWSWKQSVSVTTYKKKTNITTTSTQPSILQIILHTWI